MGQWILRCDSGNVTDDVIAQYIEMQDKIERGSDDGFQIGSDG